MTKWIASFSTRHIKILILIVIFQYSLNPKAFAVTQGVLQQTSTGTTQITFILGGLHQILGLHDIFLTPTTLSMDAVGSTTACIYSNQTTFPGMYSLIATSVNGGVGRFVATNGTTEILYKATWTDGTQRKTELSSTGILPLQLGTTPTLAACAAGNNATLEVTFKAADMQSVPSGVYRDTIILLIGPS